jgi:4-diphosphocytidyl-2-C-methyl-D-erythritol kinase
MIVFPNAKINLGLRVIRKREDGYHDLESYMVPIGLTDVLEIVPSEEGFSFSSTGLTIEGPEDQNLCVKAFKLLQRTYGIADVKIHLHKIIPMGSGLGGGSSDGAFTLSLLRKLFNLKFCNAELETLAAMLGSDCPFFIVNKPQLVTGKGMPTHKFIRMPNFHLVVIIPPVAVSTSWAYSQMKPTGVPIPEPHEIIEREDRWTEFLINDFEGPIFKQYPVLAEVKQKLYDNGAFYASMSGSGSAVYGLFKEPVDCRREFEGMFYWQGTSGCSRIIS